MLRDRASQTHEGGYITEPGPTHALFVRWIAMTTGTLYSIHRYRPYGERILSVPIEPLREFAVRRKARVRERVESDMERDRR